MPAERPESETKLQEIIKSTVESIFTQLAPTLKSMQVTPEVMAAAVREATKPYEDPARIARELRERKQSHEQWIVDQKNLLYQQSSCPHTHRGDGKNAIQLQHNYPDNMVRGICPLCGIYIEPAHWEYNAQGKPEIVKEHLLYYRVRQLEPIG